MVTKSFFRDNNVLSSAVKEMPKLISTESKINILKEEDLIKEIYEFQINNLRDHTQKRGIRYSHLSVENLK
jgi:hypothetical protein